MKLLRTLYLLLVIFIVSMASAQKQSQFTSEPIPDNVFQRMQGKSFGKDCTTKRSDLRYLRVLHCDKDGKTQVGELICNKNIAADLLDIFKKLYEARYPIESMRLVDDYDGSDERSMSANNTSCFNFRLMTGSRKRVSLHGRGLAIDINPLYNPFVSKSKVSPKVGIPYAYKRSSFSKSTLVGRMIITRQDLCYKLFIQHGFRWGGAWKRNKDYQHFEKL